MLSEGEQSRRSARETQYLTTPREWSARAPPEAGVRCFRARTGWEGVRSPFPRGVRAPSWAAANGQKLAPKGAPCRSTKTLGSPIYKTGGITSKTSRVFPSCVVATLLHEVKPSRIMFCNRTRVYMVVIASEKVSTDRCR